MKTKKDAVKFLVEMAQVTDSIAATNEVSELVKELRQLKKQLKVMSIHETALKSQIQDYMGLTPRLIDVDGTLAVTWIQGNPVTRLDVEALQCAHPRIYAKFLIEQNGNRVFLVK